MTESHKDFKKRKDLAEARQTGQAEPEMDVESGKMINPHNPEFITKRPWYLGDSGPSLKHHSLQKVDKYVSMNEADALIAKGKVVKTQRATGYRKGACRNCGAMTHKTAECVERPRSNKQAAWKTGMDIKPDERVVDVTRGGLQKITYDAKRDRWHGYDGSDQKRTIEKFNLMDSERRRLRKEETRTQEEEKRKQKKEERLKKKEEKKLEKKKAKSLASVINKTNDEDAPTDSDVTTDGMSNDNSDTDSDTDYETDEEDEDEDDTKDFIMRDEDAKDFQGRIDRQGGVGGAQMKESVRNLRIREDTAKYLRNLDPNSAFYDPKTRSMRANPLPHANPDEVLYAGDNWVRTTGEAIDFAKSQLYAWESEKRGQEIHMQANPTQTQLAQEQFKEKKDTYKQTEQSKVLEKYGGKETMRALDSRLALGETENYVVYSRDGRVVKGAPRAVARTKYQEDVLENNHTGVWGSYYDRRSMRWGYGCCHSLQRNSYCTGARGQEANDEVNSGLSIDPTQQRKMLEARPAGERAMQPPAVVSKSELYGEHSGKAEFDQEKLNKAIKEQDAFQKKAVEMDDRKRKYNSFQKEEEITPEVMEAYRLKKGKAEDPMAKLLGSDVLLGEEEEEEEEGNGK